MIIRQQTLARNLTPLVRLNVLSRYTIKLLAASKVQPAPLSTLHEIN